MDLNGAYESFAQGKTTRVRRRRCFRVRTVSLLPSCTSSRQIPRSNGHHVQIPHLSELSARFWATERRWSANLALSLSAQSLVPNSIALVTRKCTMRVAVLAAGGVLLPHGISATALQARQPQFDSDQYNAGLEPRQVHPTGATNTATAAQSWDVDTDAVCRAQIATLNGVTSNPAGLAVCYNLPSMNNATGIFEAELRLYKLSDPIEDWAGVSINDMMISLAYLGAMVQADGSEGQSASAGKRAVSSQETTLTQSARRDTTSTMIQPMRVLRYLGQLNSNVRGAQMGM